MASAAFLDVADRGELHVGLLEEAAEVVFAAAADSPPQGCRGESRGEWQNLMRVT